MLPLLGAQVGSLVRELRSYKPHRVALKKKKKKKVTTNFCSLVTQQVKNPSEMQETLVRLLGWEDLLEKGLATHSSILRLPSWLRW